MPRKNLVMISVDDMRAFGDWGHFTSLVSTPNIDRLADLGTNFQRAITQVPLCNPSRTSVLTGLPPSQTGVLDNNVPWFDRVDPASTLPAVLKSSGIYVAMYGKHFHTDAIRPRDQVVMFDDFLPATSYTSRGQVVEDEVQHDLPFQSGRYVGSPHGLRDEQVVDAAVEFLRTTAGELAQPFFLGVGLFKPHLNWWVPPEFFDRYEHATIRAALELSLRDGTIIPGDVEYADVPPMSRPSQVHTQMKEEIDLWVDYLHGYLAALSYADAKVGEVLDALEADPVLAESTAVLLWSDHGYHLGDQDRWEKFTHWKAATQVPLIVVDPDAPGGQTASQVVSLVDIFPTTLDLLGVDAPRELGLAGHSLLPVVRNVDTAWYDPAAGKGVALTTVHGSVSLRAVVPNVGDLRYTRYPDGTEELYNLDADPNEHVNRVEALTGTPLTTADETPLSIMRDLMHDRLAEVGMLIGDGGGSVVGSPADELLVAARGQGRDVLSGGGGDDTYVLYSDAAVIEAPGGGFDAIFIMNAALESNFALPPNVEMVRVQRDFTGDDRDDWIFGGGASGVLSGAGGNDTIDAGPGDDTIEGGPGDDTLRGDFGRDVVAGGPGDDALTGGGGADRLEGGTGRDIFHYHAPGESGPAASDTIVGFDGPGPAGGDQIDLSAIDANAVVPGKQSFKFGSTSTGYVWVVEVDGNSEVLANIDTDLTPELRIVIDDGGTPASAYSSDDFSP